MCTASSRVRRDTASPASISNSVQPTNQPTTTTLLLSLLINCALPLFFFILLFVVIACLINSIIAAMGSHMSYVVLPRCSPRIAPSHSHLHNPRADLPTRQSFGEKSPSLTQLHLSNHHTVNKILSVNPQSGTADRLLLNRGPFLPLGRAPLSLTPAPRSLIRAKSAPAALITRPSATDLW